MRLPSSLLFVLIALSLSLVGAQVASEGASIETVEHEQFGTYLTDSEGRSLYLFTDDERGAPSTCAEECAQNWPPFIVEQAPAAGEGVAASLVGTVERDDGSLQATYFGWPLYYFARDEEPGDVAGHGVGGKWFLVSNYGQPVAAPEPTDETQDGEEQQAETEQNDVDSQNQETTEAEEVPAELMAEGGRLYRQYCAACHGEEGGGGTGTRLVNHSRLANPERVARQIIYGGGFMPSFGDQLDDEEVAAVGTFIRNSWGNSFGILTPEQASEQRR